MNNKQLWVLAGGNGAGKSTFYRTRLKAQGMPFINADIFAAQLYPHDAERQSYDAAKIAAEMRKKLITQGRSFCMETVFSHPSKIDFLAQAKAMGYQIILVFIHLELTVLNQARIAQRVSEGGHTVPEDKVINRIPRLLKNIKQTLPLCNQVYILNNSSAENPFQRVATLIEGRLEAHAEIIPDWCQKLLECY